MSGRWPPAGLAKAGKRAGSYLLEGNEWKTRQGRILGRGRTTSVRLKWTVPDLCGPGVGKRCRTSLGPGLAEKRCTGVARFWVNEAELRVRSAWVTLVRHGFDGLG